MDIFDVKWNVRIPFYWKSQGKQDVFQRFGSCSRPCSRSLCASFIFHILYKINELGKMSTVKSHSLILGNYENMLCSIIFSSFYQHHHFLTFSSFSFHHGDDPTKSSSSVGKITRFSKRGQTVISESSILHMCAFL